MSMVYFLLSSTTAIQSAERSFDVQLLCTPCVDEYALLINTVGLGLNTTPVSLSSGAIVILAASITLYTILLRHPG